MLTAAQLGDAVTKHLRALAVQERERGNKSTGVALNNAADDVVRALEWEAQGDSTRALEALSTC